MEGIHDQGTYRERVASSHAFTEAYALMALRILNTVRKATER